MKTALSFSLKENMLSKSEYNLIINHIDNSGLPCSIKKYFSIRDLNKVLSFMIKDKKNYSESNEDSKNAMPTEVLEKLKASYMANMNIDKYVK